MVGESVADGVADAGSEGESGMSASGVSDLASAVLRRGLLDKWKQQDWYPICMRLAELSTMWHVNGWSKSVFLQFLS